jgi:hypothetical protein
MGSRGERRPTGKQIVAAERELSRLRHPADRP